MPLTDNLPTTGKLRLNCYSGPSLSSNRRTMTEPKTSWGLYKASGTMFRGQWTGHCGSTPPGGSVVNKGAAIAAETLRVRVLCTEDLPFRQDTTRINDDIQELSVTDETLPVEKFDHLYWLKTVLRETLDAINRVSVTLDVETANPWLEVSEDRKSVRPTRTWRNLPDTGKRFTDQPCVLGSEGFTSGRHDWEVEVTGNRGWYLGVAAESVKRKGGVSLSPETGFWVIGWDGEVLHRGCDVYGDPTSPESGLPAGPIPGRVGVYLSYESGTVSFYNAETKSHLHTFTGNKFTGKLYPFFATWDENQWLRICSSSAPGL
ncbi:E3 ubiquitin-protein ligase TRIM39-like [Hemitrygon akajei]|uniref:E3 ubiquitin-protein ligase TRIM39-like n=1 Tax=Hemitrygon akajei TaxID=2704970 RepID=UPI003BF97095